ncbi:MAG: hypothetical protein ABIH42_11145, partial [Planctomycetota bacterium]
KILKEEFIPNIKNQIEFPDSLEQPPQETAPGIHLRQILSESQNNLRNRSARKALFIPEKDWGIEQLIKKENTPEEISELRLRISAAEKFLAACIENNVIKVISIEQKQLSLQEIENTSYAILYYPIVVKLESDYDSLLKTLLAFQKKSSFLEVRSLTIRSKEKDDCPVSATIEFGIIRFDEKSTLMKSAAITEETRTDRDTRQPIRVPRRRY